MQQQNYANHRRMSPPYHYVTAPLVITAFVIAIINLVHTMGTTDWLYTGVLPMLYAVILMLCFVLLREFPKKVQDRVIRAEENFRVYVLTGKQLDQSLSMGQILALRFASDEEYLALSRRAIAEHMKPDDIKKAVKSWRADHYRC